MSSLVEMDALRVARPDGKGSDLGIEKINASLAEAGSRSGLQESCESKVATVHGGGVPLTVEFCFQKPFAWSKIVRR
jgi:hypothetical protein